MELFCKCVNMSCLCIIKHYYSLPWLVIARSIGRTDCMMEFRLKACRGGFCKSFNNLIRGSTALAVDCHAWYCIQSWTTCLWGRGHLTMQGSLNLARKHLCFLAARQCLPGLPMQSLDGMEVTAGRCISMCQFPTYWHGPHCWLTTRCLLQRCDGLLGHCWGLPTVDLLEEVRFTGQALKAYSIAMHLSWTSMSSCNGTPPECTKAKTGSGWAWSMYWGLSSSGLCFCSNLQKQDL